jgi:hypothetical protein
MASVGNRPAVFVEPVDRVAAREVDRENLWSGGLQVRAA